MSAQHTSEEAIVIIGGGICGICTAYFLSRDSPETQIVLIEAEGVASKASGKAGGFIAKDWHGSATASLGRLSFDLHAELAEELDGGKAYGYRTPLTNISISVKAVDKGAEVEANRAPLVVGADSHQAQDLHSHSAAHEIIFRARPAATGPAPSSTWLDHGNVRERELIGDPSGSAQVHPRRFCETLWGECERRGVRLLLGEVEGMAQDPRSLRVKTTDGAKTEIVPFGKVVVAAGPWSGQVLEKMCNFDAGITNLPGHSVIIEPSQALPAEAVFADIRGVRSSDTTTGPELFVRPDSEEGRTTVYVAGENTGEPLPDDLHDRSYDEEAIKRLLKACALISPALANGRVVSKALCYRPMTERGYPVISAVPGHEGIFLVSGHGPWGISLGPGSGRVMADLVLGKSPSADITLLGLQ
ncbi:hypothetical protein A4X13_0g2618 [Tilletia indica]|uniref:FAD dependent oxidoreductase domain-containing protein n=1 Tax=Tilletia indica TaxID=43049 RepID=A0A177TWK7_9BASI|nr:hypothetical protein A4X13_0g2618 [Tilletia indica]